MTLVATLLALSAGAFFAVSVHVQRRGLEHTDDLIGALITVATMAAIFWLAAPFFVKSGWWLTHAALLFAACGLIFPAFGQRLGVASVAHVGPATTSAIGAFAPVFAVIPAVLILGETLTLQAATGLTVMIAALILAAMGPSGFRPGRSSVALLLPLGASLVRGVIQPVAKAGYAEVPSAVFSTLVMATVSTLVLTVIVAATRGRQAAAIPAPALRWFALSGLIVGAGIFSWQVALSLADVVIVAPLVSTTPLWAVLLGRFVFRHERLGPRHAIVAAMVVLGTVLIVTR